LNRLRALSPSLVVNCAAATDVEGAQRDPAEDYEANVVLPGLLAEAAKLTGATLIHISSTGCYGVAKSTPYEELDEVQPTTVHHRHKLEGENEVRRVAVDSIIVRTGWLYDDGQSKKNFVWKRLVEALSAPKITSDASQRGVPTFAGDCARQVLAIAKSDHRGLFNVTAQGSASRYEYVHAIVEAAGLPCDVVPGLAYARLAPVSANETAVNRRLQSLGLDQMPHWEASLVACVKSLLKSPAWSGLTRVEPDK
jgi:dTDP-4-dehydrorhamnose reductase